MRFSDWLDPDEIEPDENDGLYCDFCDKGPPEVEIYHHCSALGTICVDCDNSGEYPEYWGEEE